ncbi:hypothetical protein OSTOST_07905 [Ostertagia ostertagi]
MSFHLTLRLRSDHCALQEFKEESAEDQNVEVENVTPQLGLNEMNTRDKNKQLTVCENESGVVVVEVDSRQPDHEDFDYELMDLMSLNELNLIDSDDDDDETTGDLAVSMMENIGIEQFEPNIQNDDEMMSSNQNGYEMMPNNQDDYELVPNIENDFEMMSDSSDESMPDFENTVFPAPPVESSASEDEDAEADPALLNVIGENYANQSLLTLLADILNNQVRGLHR